MTEAYTYSATFYFFTYMIFYFHSIDTTHLAEIERKIHESVGELYRLLRRQLEVVKKSLSIVLGNNKA